jgi:hypothetical protein
MLFPAKVFVAGMEYGALWVTLPNSLAVLFTIRPISPVQMKIAWQREVEKPARATV